MKKDESVLLAEARVHLRRRTGKTMEEINRTLNANHCGKQGETDVFDMNPSSFFLLLLFCSDKGLTPETVTWEKMEASGGAEFAIRSRRQSALNK